jgi:hypothetical protein
MRPLPGLGNPLAEGSLMRKGQDKDEWISTYCILKADVFYMFRDDTRSDLIGIVNLSRHGENGLQMASVKKIEAKGWDVMGSITKRINQLTRTTSYDTTKLDNNQIRILILKIAEQLKLFTLFNMSEELEVSIKLAETLSARLRQGAAMEQLLEFISTFSFKYGDIISALIDAGVAYDVSDANAIFNFLLKGG